MVEESLSAQAVIRAFAVEHLGAAAFRTRNETLTRSAMKARLWSAFVERFTGAGILSEQVFVLCVSLWLVYGREMTVGTMVGLQMLTALLGSSLLYLVEYLPVLVSAQEAFQEFAENLQETSAVVDAPDARILPAFTSKLCSPMLASTTSVSTLRTTRTGSPMSDEPSHPRGLRRSSAPVARARGAMLSMLMRFHKSFQWPRDYRRP